MHAFFVCAQARDYALVRLEGDRATVAQCEALKEIADEKYFWILDKIPDLHLYIERADPAFKERFMQGERWLKISFERSLSLEEGIHST